MTQQATVTILHSIPGRLRTRLSTAPRNPDKFIESVMGHEGLRSAQFAPVTRSVLVRYVPGSLTDHELVLRIAMALSLERGNVAVQVFTEPESEVITNSAVYAGFVIVCAAAMRWLGKGGGNLLFDKAAGLGTGAAVLEHGWREVRARGYFDPEVLSLVYLLAACLRGEFLRGAVVTWASSFGRHLINNANTGVEVRPIMSRAQTDEERRFELVVVRGQSQRAPLFSFLRAMAQFMMTGGAGTGSSLFEDLRNVSKAHGDVVEGLGPMLHGIPLRFK